jgi:hypothetical protein
MQTRRAGLTIVVMLAYAVALPPSTRGAEPMDKSKATARVYGEWRILVKPDKGPEYNALIEERGLPLFRKAGGRMVGWWNSLIGNLYEHVTIWEYDDMAAFEQAVAFLGGEKKFAEFVAARDPLLTGEQNRFLRLVEHSEPPVLADPAKFVIHEVHRVPQNKMAAYVEFMTGKGLMLLKAHGFHPVGPWRVEVGSWCEVTYLFRFDSLSQRTRLIDEFSKHGDAKVYGDAIGNFVEEITTRLLTPAPFARGSSAQTALDPIHSTFLPHVAQVADGVFAAGFADRYGSANCGWVALSDSTLLIDVPRGLAVPEFLAEVARITGKPPRALALTHNRAGDEATIASLLDGGVSKIFTTAAIGARLSAAWKSARVLPVREFSQPSPIGDETVRVNILPADDVFQQGGAAVRVQGRSTVFAGPLVVNGPRAVLAGSNTELWAARLRSLGAEPAAHVIPGFGSWEGRQLLRRQRRFLEELRRQIGYLIAQGHSEAMLKEEIRLPADCLVWMPYDTPTLDDLEHVYRELTVPQAPFNGHAPDPNDPHPHALVLVGDQPHEPGHIIEGLRPLFEASGVVPHFTVDVRALSASNLAKVKLLVILRDGLQRPTADPATHFMWMTAEQQQAVKRFVNGGGGFLNLHNSMGLYPENGPYLKLVGGRYIGHGPLERFRVDVVDASHPITRGIEAFSVADEQHTPPYDAAKVHLLLRNRSDDGKTAAAAGWAYEPGRGRLCHLANGHTRESLDNPTYQKLLRNAIDWCLRHPPSVGQSGKAQ